MYAVVIVRENSNGNKQIGRLAAFILKYTFCWFSRLNLVSVASANYSKFVQVLRLSRRST